MLVNQVVERLTQRVSAFEGRVEKASAWAEMIKTGQFPKRTPAAFVMPEGIQAGPPLDITGVFQQPVRRIVGVMTIVSSHDRTGERALDGLDGIISDIETAICGWQPDTYNDVFALRSGQIMETKIRGALIYGATFTINSILRITP